MIILTMILLGMCLRIVQRKHDLSSVTMGLHGWMLKPEIWGGKGFVWAP